MTRHMKIRKIGNSLGVVLPKELLAELQVGEGDVLYPVRTADGIRLQRHDPGFERAVETARDVMRRYPNTMKTLAK